MQLCTTVVGAPIDVNKIESPIDKDVDDLHQKFIDGLKELFDQNKEKYCENPPGKLIEEMKTILFKTVF